MRKQTSIVLLTVAAVSLAVRLAALTAFQNTLLFEPLEGSGHDRAVYTAAAAAAAQGSFFPGGAFEYLPLYPWLLGLAGRVFGSGPGIAAALGIACDTLTALLITLFARRLGASDKLSAAAGLLYACYPLAAVYSLLSMPNTLNTLGVTAFAYLAHGLCSRARTGGGSSGPVAAPSERPAVRPRLSFFALGLFGGVFTLGFAGMLLIIAAVAVYAAVRMKRLLPPLLLLAGAVIPIAPVAVHNSRAEGSFVLLTTHGGFNYYMGNHERATGYPLRVANFRMTAKEMLEDAHRHAERASGQTMTRAESSSWWKEQADAWRSANRGDAFLLTVRKTLLFWNHRDVDDLRMRERLGILSPFFDRMDGVPFAVFGVLGLAGLLLMRGGAVPRLTLLAGTAGIVMFFITARYRLTFVPLMAVTGAAAAGQLAAAWREGKRLRPLLTLPLLVIVLLPFPLRDQRPADYYNTAVQLTAAGETGRAEEIIRRGLAIDPGYGMLYFAQGNILFTGDRFAEAAESYETAKTLLPGNPTVLYNLALAYGRTEQYCRALDAMNELAAAAPLTPRQQELLRQLESFCRNADAAPPR